MRVRGEILLSANTSVLLIPSACLYWRMFTLARSTEASQAFPLGLDHRREVLNHFLCILEWISVNTWLPNAWDFVWRLIAD
jgi:hypothetical protein